MAKVFISYFYLAITTMNYFLDEDNVKTYTDMISDYDNTYIMNELHKFLPIHSSLLELGMGTGKDLITLAKTYNVVGSDYSPIFIKSFQQISSIPVLLIDAISINIDQTFDCIYSNKVLQHLTPSDMATSLEHQAMHLNSGGILFFTIWKGAHREELMFEDTLRFTYYTEDDIKKVLPESLRVETITSYSEFETDDSLLVVLRK